MLKGLSFLRYLLQLVGTPNQVLVDVTTIPGEAIFRTPQDIATTSTPTFAGINAPIVLPTNAVAVTVGALLGAGSSATQPSASDTPHCFSFQLTAGAALATGDFATVTWATALPGTHWKGVGFFYDAAVGATLSCVVNSITANGCTIDNVSGVIGLTILHSYVFTIFIVNEA